MTLVHVEGWDGMSDVLQRYSYSGSKPTIDASIFRNGTKSLKCTSYNYKCNISLPSQQTYVFGFALYLNTYQINLASPTLQAILLSGSGGNQNSILFDDSGHILVYRGSTLLAISIQTFSIKTWFYVEVLATCTNSISADEYVIKVNGVEWINLPATTDTQNEASPGFSTIRFAGGYSSGIYYYDDIYVCDLNGSVNNDFLGDSVVEVLNPNGNGNANQFDGSDGNSVDNYLLVDDVVPDDDTTYVESDTVSQQDQYALSDLTGSIGTIHGVAARNQCKKDAAGARTGKAIVRSGSADYEGAEFVPTESYFGYDHIWEQDPDTSNAWLEAGINAAEFGIKVES
jgi:hypothetical protein